MKKFLIALMISAFFIAGCATTGKEMQSQNTVPAEQPAKPAVKTVADMAMESNLPIVNFDYVMQNLDNSNVVFIDARPARLFAKGHIPGAVNLEQMKFEKVYPEFAALNIPKDKELIFGIGKDCPLSYNDALSLRKVGYTNLKLYIKPEIWLNAGYLQLEEKEAVKMVKNAVVLKPSESAAPSDKEAVIIIHSQGDAKPAFKMIDDLRSAGYTKLYYYTGTL